MPFPVEITAHQLDLPENVRELVRERAEHLERFFQRILRCRVVIDGPDGHNRIGGTYQVHVDLQVPGQLLTVNQKEDHDLILTIRQAFEAARRQLEDYARKLRGEVKHRGESP